MDLKTFAIHKKLQTDSSLLRYVMKGEPIPIPIVEESFRDYLDPLQDRMASRLIEDYVGLIGDEIPVTTQRMADGGYQISGEIPDRIVEAIELVHQITPEEIVSSLVNHNTKTVHGQALSIMDIDLADAARKTLLDAVSIPKIIPSEEIQESDLFKPDLPGDLETISEAKQASEPSTAMLQTEPVSETTEIKPYTGSVEDVFPEDTVLEESKQPRPEDVFREAVHRVYDKLVADLIAYGLDQRLNLSI